MTDTISISSSTIGTITTAPVTHYKLEHLLTFTSDHRLKNIHKINSEVYQKIANLEKQNKLFVQDIILHIDGGSVKLLEDGSLNIVETYKFKDNNLLSIFDLTGKFRTVNSLLVLVTQDKRRDPKTGKLVSSGSNPDVNIFQCPNRMQTASIIRKDIQAALNDFENYVRLWGWVEKNMNNSFFLFFFLNI